MLEKDCLICLNFANVLNVNARSTKVFLFVEDAAVNRAERPIYSCASVPVAERTACRETTVWNAATLEIQAAEDVANDSPL